jgi:nucleotide-binding universal stress UspA family protein
MYDRVLIPTDGSDTAEAAAESAMTVAELFDAQLHVVHVLELGDLPAEYEDVGADEFAHSGDESVSRIADRAMARGLDVERNTFDGGSRVHEALLAYVDDHDVDLVVMGTHGRTGLDRLVLGSVAELVVRESPVPVLTVHEDGVLDAEVEKVLAPTDGSDSALAAVDEAIEVVAETGASLHTIYAVDTHVVWGGIGAESVMEAMRTAGRKALDDVVDRATAAEVTVEASAMEGTPHRAIVDYAEEHDVDLIVLGTHGRRGFDRYLLGSVAERVIRTAETPVMTVKAVEVEE